MGRQGRRRDVEVFAPEDLTGGVLGNDRDLVRTLGKAARSEDILPLRQVADALAVDEDLERRGQGIPPLGLADGVALRHTRQAQFDRYVGSLDGSPLWGLDHGDSIVRARRRIGVAPRQLSQNQRCARRQKKRREGRSRHLRLHDCPPFYSAVVKHIFIVVRFCKADAFP